MQAREQREAAEAREAHLHYMQFRAMGWLERHGLAPLCWIRGSVARRRTARFLPGCTPDGCVEYLRLEHAAAVCEILGDGCGGVTAVEARSSYQTRAGRRLQAGPSEEASWVKRRCVTSSTLDQEAIEKHAIDEDDWNGESIDG